MARKPTPPAEPLNLSEEALHRLADEARVLRHAVDELREVVEWAVENNRVVIVPLLTNPAASAEEKGTTPTGPCDRIAQECETIAVLQKKLKDRAMIYQVDLKERLAQQHGLSNDAYYHLPYDEWVRIRDGGDHDDRRPSPAPPGYLF